MPRLPSINSWEIINALKKAGFIEHRQKEVTKSSRKAAGALLFRFIRGT